MTMARMQQNRTWMLTLFGGGVLVVGLAAFAQYASLQNLTLGNDVLNTISYYLIGLTLWLVAGGLLILAARRALSVSSAQVLALVFFLAVLVVVALPLADLDQGWAHLIVHAAVLALGPTFVYYHTIFPDSVQFRFKTVLLAVLYAAGLFLLLFSTLGVLSPSWLAPGSALARLAANSTAAVYAYFFLCAFLGLLLLVRTYQVAQFEATHQRQIAFVTLSTALAFLPLIVLVVMPHLLSIPFIVPVPTWVGLAALALVPASYWYAIRREQTMRFDRIVNRIVVYTMLAFVVVALYMLGLWSIRQGVRLAAGKVPGLDAQLINTALIVVLALALWPLKKRVQALVDHAFYGGWYNYEALISQMSEVFNQALTLPGIVDSLLDGIESTLRVRAVALLLPLEQAFVVQKSVGFGREVSLARDGAVAGALQDRGRPVAHTTLWTRFRTDDDRGGLYELDRWPDVRVWVPLLRQGSLEGLLILGDKAAGDLYRAEDYQTLETLAHQAAVAIARVQLLDELKHRVREVQLLSQQLQDVSERNQQQLALELHDQTIQDLAFVNQQLDGVAKDPRPARIRGVQTEVLRIVEELRVLIFELRPAALEHDTLPEMFEMYASTFEEMRGLPVVFTIANDRDLPVPKETRETAFRIFQESLNNARKYARAQQVSVTLDLRPGWLTLSIQDNGVGFEVPRRLGDLLAQRHMGLVGMRERAERLGGTFDVESQPGRGTRIVVGLPLPVEQQASKEDQPQPLSPLP